MASVVGSAATAKHFVPNEEGSGVTMPEIPDVCEQIMLLVVKGVPAGKVGLTPQNGMDSELERKSDGFPVKSQRSVKSPRPLPPVLKSCPLEPSNMSHGCEL